MNYFLSSTSYHFNQHSFPLLIGCCEGKDPVSILLNQEILDNYQIVTFNSSILVDFCRNQNLNLPKNFIDVFQLYKLVNGTPIKYHRFSEIKLIWIVFKNFINEDKLKNVIDILDYSPNKIRETQSTNKLIQFNYYLQEVFYKLESLLKVKGEYERYIEVEKPFNELLCQRQYYGINICSKRLNEKTEKVKSDINIYTKDLRYNFNIYSPHNINEIKRALVLKNYDYLSKAINTKSFWSFVKSGSENDEFLKLIYDVYRLRFDKINLIKILVEEDGKIYPIFDCCGSITSRALVRFPYIQQLRKTSRDIFIAKDGYSLLYADYSQFEPGILASLANDESLISCYIKDDLYSSLSLELFGDEGHRPLCKIIFLSFMYGMSIKGLEYLIKDFFRNKKDIDVSLINSFFSKFQSLIPYKKDLENKALKEKRICSCLGNYRYFESKSNKVLPSKVKRWILSQKIQGTASLILKTAILKCTMDPEIEFLIPMHDAALFQVPANKVELKKSIIKKEFEDAFLKYCKEIKPKIAFKDFTE